MNYIIAPVKQVYVGRAVTFGDRFGEDDKRWQSWHFRSNYT